MTRRPTLVLDFDGVLHSYTSPWAGPTVVPDDPVPGARDFLLAALERFDVCVVSSRSHELGGPGAMARWMRWKMGGSVVFLEDGPAWTPNRAADEDEDEEALPEGPYVKFPLHKPPAHVTLDDRALTFSGTWPSVETLLAFRPWNRGGLTPYTDRPADGSEEGDLWLDAVYACGFTEVDVNGPEGRAGAGFRCTAEQVLRLMAVAREQGRRDVLGLRPRPLEDRK